MWKKTKWSEKNWSIKTIKCSENKPIPKKPPPQPQTGAKQPQPPLTPNTQRETKQKTKNHWLMQSLYSFGGGSLSYLKEEVAAANNKQRASYYRHTVSINAYVPILQKRASVSLFNIHDNSWMVKIEWSSILCVNAYLYKRHFPLKWVPHPVESNIPRLSAVWNLQRLGFKNVCLWFSLR